MVSLDLFMDLETKKAVDGQEDFVLVLEHWKLSLAY